MRISAALLMTAFLALPAAAEEESALEELPAEETTLTLRADVVGGLNPRAFSTLIGLDLRYIYSRDPENPLLDGLYLQGGVDLGPNPSWLQLSAHVEWTPLAVLRLRVQYDLYGYFGAFGALLSFPGKQARYGRRQREALEDQEESGFGQRVLFQPTLQIQLGPVIVRNQTDIAAYFLPGHGPYLLELEYDTLLREDADGLSVNRTQVMFQAWKGEGAETLILGPQYEVLHAWDSSLTRQRVGGLLYYVPTTRLWWMDLPRIYLWAGYNIQDRNRDGEFFVVGGVGFDVGFDIE